MTLREARELHSTPLTCCYYTLNMKYLSLEMCITMTYTYYISLNNSVWIYVITLTLLYDQNIPYNTISMCYDFYINGGRLQRIHYIMLSMSKCLH